MGFMFIWLFRVLTVKSPSQCNISNSQQISDKQESSVAIMGHHLLGAKDGHDLNDVQAEDEVNSE